MYSYRVPSNHKLKAWDGFCHSIDHKDSLSFLGEEQELSLATAGKCEAYVWSLYTASKKTSTADELCYQKKQKNEMLPPTSDSLLQHLKQSNYQAFVWRHTFEAMQDLEPPGGHGWVRNKELFVLLLVTKVPEPERLFELTTCKYKNVCLLEKLLPHQQRTCLHRKVLLHGRR